MSQKTYKAAVIQEAGGKLVMEDRPIPTPGLGQVLIKVAACGVCHSDKFTVHGQYEGITLPRVPGHEVTGHVVSVGDGVEWPEIGDFVGAGWHGSYCLFCDACRHGDFMMCPKAQVCGIHFDGGYQEYCLVHWTGVTSMPDGLDPVQAAPLLCAGITCFNGLRHQPNLRPGDLVAIQGIGGLGHLGIQFAAKMGYRVAAISSSADKRELATQLGAHHYIDTSVKPASEQLLELGGAKIILATAPNSKSYEDLVNGLGIEGRLVIVGAEADTFTVNPFQLIPKRTHVCGWPSGTAADAEDTCKFAQFAGIESMNEVFPFEKAQEAYDHMMSGKCRFRVVIKMS